MALIECPKCFGSKCTFCNQTGRVVKATAEQKRWLGSKNARTTPRKPARRKKK